MEWLSPWRRATNRVQERWLTNLGLMLLGGIAVSLLFPVSLEEVAASLEEGWMRQLPTALEALLLFLLLDFWRYWEHRIFHEVPLLWRAHLVHHSDTHLDITTGQRHHPIEAVLATCTALLLVFALGFSAQALAVYLGAATLSALWTHANIKLPERIDRPLRLWLVTPAVHAVHHSDHQPQTDSNYGTLLTIWDRMFGTYTDPSHVEIPNFGLEYFHRTGDLALAPVLLQPFEYRRGMPYPARVPVGDTVDRPRMTLSAAWRRALVQLSFALALALIALWPTALSMAGLWAGAESYQYAWLVLPMFIYVVGWYHRDRILALAPRPDALGLPVIAVAVAGWSLATLVDIQLGQHLAFVLVLQGIALCALGRTVYRQLFPILALLFLMVPCGDLLQPLLRELTVRWIEWFTVLFGLPHSVDGFMVYVGEHRYVVIDPCSGLTFVTLAGFLGYSFGLLLFNSFGKILALAAVGATLGVLTNALRVWLIVGIDWLQGSQMDMAAHLDLQWLALLSALALLFYLTARLASAAGAGEWPSSAPGRASRWRPAGFAPLIAGILVLLVATPIQRLQAHGTASGFDSLQLLANTHPQSRWLQGKTGEGRTLLIPQNSQLEIIVAEPLAYRSRVDESVFDPEGDRRWRHTATNRFTGCIDDICTQFVHKTWNTKGLEETRHALYTYYVDDTTTDSKLIYRLASGWNRIAAKGSSHGLIGFRIRGELPAETMVASTFQRVSNQLLAAEGAAENPDPGGAPAVAVNQHIP